MAAAIATAIAAGEMIERSKDDSAILPIEILALDQLRKAFWPSCISQLPVGELGFVPDPSRKTIPAKTITILGDRV